MVPVKGEIKMQMMPFELDKKDALIKMLNGKEHILVTISKDEGSLVTDQVISTSNYKFNGDVLILNDKTQIPVTDQSIEFVAKDHAEICFIDQDGYMTHIKIIAR
jgi:membrane-bound inhibitor of C-type lysozyme